MKKMKNVETNEFMMFSNEQFILTERGLVKAKDIKKGDNIFGIAGDSTIVTNIIPSGKRQDVQIIKE